MKRTRISRAGVTVDSAGAGEMVRGVGYEIAVGFTGIRKGVQQPEPVGCFVDKSVQTLLRRTLTNDDSVSHKVGRVGKGQIGVSGETATCFGIDD